MQFCTLRASDASYSLQHYENAPGTGLTLLRSLVLDVVGVRCAPLDDTAEVVREPLGLDVLELCLEPLGRGVELPLPEPDFFWLGKEALFQTLTRVLRARLLSVCGSLSRGRAQWEA